MSKHTPFAVTDFVAVELRHRDDGWTPARQCDFLLALSESACVEDACRSVGKSPASAYALRRRIDAVSFRAAWQAALDYGVTRLADAALSRALNGVARPIFYKGEQVGEWRHYNERLTMFLLRYRDSARYGKWRDHDAGFRGGEEAIATRAERLIENTHSEAEELAEYDAASHVAEEAEGHVGEEAVGHPEDNAKSVPEGDFGGDVSSTSSTSE